MSMRRYVPSSEHEQAVRAFVTARIQATGLVPTVREVRDAVGGQQTLTVAILREYRAASWADMRRPRESDTNESP